MIANQICTLCNCTCFKTTCTTCGSHLRKLCHSKMEAKTTSNAKSKNGNPYRFADRVCRPLPSHQVLSQSETVTRPVSAALLTCLQHTNPASSFSRAHNTRSDTMLRSSKHTHTHTQKDARRWRLKTLLLLLHTLE